MLVNIVRRSIDYSIRGLTISLAFWCAEMSNILLIKCLLRSQCQVSMSEKKIMHLTSVKVVTNDNQGTKVASKIKNSLMCIVGIGVLWLRSLLDDTPVTLINHTNVTLEYMKVTTKTTQANKKKKSVQQKWRARTLKRRHNRIHTL